MVFAGAVQGKMNTASHQLSSQMETEADGVSKQCRQRPAAHRSQQSVERQEKDVARLRKMGNASTRNAYSSSQQKVSSHSHGISNIEGLIVSTTPEPKVKQKRIREPDCHKKGGWVAIGTFVVTHPSEKVPILCNTRYKRKSRQEAWWSCLGACGGRFAVLSLRKALVFFLVADSRDLPEFQRKAQSVCVWHGKLRHHG